MLFRIATTILALGALGCGHEVVQIHTTAVANPTHSVDIQPIWDANCTFSGCHTSGGSAGGLALEGDAYGELVSVVSDDTSLDRVEPGTTELSYVWHKLNDTHDLAGGSGGAMPLHGDPLFDPDLETIENWILTGAPQ